MEWHGFSTQLYPSWPSTVQTFNSCTSWPDVYRCMVIQTPMETSKNKPSTSSIHVAFESKLRSMVRSSMPKKDVAFERRVVYYAHAFCAGIKCQCCSSYLDIAVDIIIDWRLENHCGKPWRNCFSKIVQTIKNFWKLTTHVVETTKNCCQLMLRTPLSFLCLEVETIRENVIETCCGNH